MQKKSGSFHQQQPPPQMNLITVLFQSFITGTSVSDVTRVIDSIRVSGRLEPVFLKSTTRLESRLLEKTGIESESFSKTYLLCSGESRTTHANNRKYQSNPVATGIFSGLSPPKLKYETV